MKKQIEVINTGIGNYNTSQEVAAFKERGSKFDPDMVILAFFLNDGEPTPKPVEGFLPRYSNLYVLAAASWDNTLRWTGSRQDYKDYYGRLYEEDKPGWQLNKQAMRDLIQLCKERRIDLRIAILPELHKLTKADYEFMEVHDKVRAIGKEGGVPVYDLLDASWPDAPETYWVTPTDAHPNEKGHKVLGKALYEALKGARQE